VSIQIMTPGYGGAEIKRSTAEIPEAIPYFRAFVTTITEHVAARLVRDKLCISNAKSMEDMDSMGNAEFKRLSLLQFTHWNLVMHYDFLVPVPPHPPQGSGGCVISSPWIDLALVRSPVPAIRAAVRWNEHQLLADQAILASVHNVPQSMAMPLKPREFGYFIGKYLENPEYLREPTAKPIEEIVPPDILWLLRRSGRGGVSRLVTQGEEVEGFMHKATEKGAEGYTNLVLALIDRCFVSDETKWTYFYYNNILDATDLIPLEQYRIDALAR
jgi:hypothetical protein